MFTTITEVKTITGKIVKADLVERAQYIIEAYVGRMENEVSVDTDIEILKRAVAYQAAYMLNNEDIVFEQMSVSTTGQNDAYTTFKPGDKISPFIAPMAVIVCNRLSFIKSRSIMTGKIFQPNTTLNWMAL
jgi:ATP-dependent DNA ligase